MEIVHAIKLASNISSFLDFTSDLSSKLNALDSAQDIDLAIETLLINLRGHTAKVFFEPPDGGDLLSQEHELFYALTLRCQKFSSYVSATLERLLEITRDAKNEGLSTFDLDPLHDQEQLLVLRKDLQERMAPIQWLSISQVMKELSAKSARLETNRSEEIQKLTLAIDKSFLGLRDYVKDDGASTILWLQILQYVERATTVSTELKILSELHFWTIKRREESVSKEHESTFEWIFTPKPNEGTSHIAPGFNDWLENDESLYWIAGKPGCGKSTLMKFIAGSPETMKQLIKWASDDSIFAVSFYFWSSAKDSLQKSDLGLLRSILFQILRQCPDLIRSTFPNQWNHRHSKKFGHQMTHIVSDREELLASYQRISSQLLDAKVKLCLFIDGLDEFDGNPLEIARLMKSLCQVPNIKACISSRPWPDFELIFGHDNHWRLNVHECTALDMHVYVNGLLQANSRFQELQKTHSKDEVARLTDKVVQKAEGVFLWVFLVVRALTDGLMDQDRLCDLHSRLSAIPNDLEEYFEQMLFNIDEGLREQMAQTFLVTIHAAQTLPLVCYQIVGKHDSENTWTRSPSRLHLDFMVARLKSFSAGLLKPDNLLQDLSELQRHQWLFGFRIDFIHRTVGDFLRTAKMTQQLAVWSSDLFNVDLEICKSCLATIESTAPKHDMFEDPTRACSSIHVFLSHAKLLERSISRDAHTFLLDELVGLLRAHSKTLDNLMGMILGPGNFWAYGSTFDFCVLYHIASYDIGEYIITKLKQKSLLFPEQPSALLAGCLSFDPRVRAENATLNKDTIHLLLDHGLNPNLPWGDRNFSFWQQLVTTTYGRYLKGAATQLEYDAILDSLTHGADKTAIIEIFGSRQGSKIIDIVQKMMADTQLSVV